MRETRVPNQFRRRTPPHREIRVTSRSAGRGRRGNDRRDEIVRKAIESFQRHGYHNTTIENIAHQLGLTKGSVYYYVEGKQDLLFEAHRFAMGLLRRGLKEIAALNASPQKKLERAIRHHIRAVIDELSLATVLLQQEYSLSAAQRRKIVAMRDEYEQLFRAVILEGIAKGVFRPVDVRVIGFAILGALNWMPHWFSHSGRLGKDEVADMFVDYLVPGLDPGRYSVGGWASTLRHVDGRVVVIAGVAGRIGQAVARALVAQGAKVALVNTGISSPDELMGPAEVAGGEAEAFDGETAHPADVQRLRDRVLERYGRINGLVHALDTSHTVSILKTDVSTWDELIGTRLRSSFVMLREIARVMAHQRDGRVVLLSDVIAPGLREITQLLADELTPYGVGVNAVARRAALVPVASEPEHSDGGAAGAAGRSAGIRLQDYVGPILFLLSPAAASLHGEVMALSGSGNE
jgi:AcrR family transcriptional regulator/NAD(P)-dependent dehydrogenase (short-subunit alcohol dehydrogenase family)